MPGEVALDQPPTRRIITILRRKRPYKVHVVGKNDAGYDGEGMPFHGIAKCVPQELKGIRRRKYRTALVGYEGKEIRSTGDVKTTIFHIKILHSNDIVGFRAEKNT